MAANVLETPSVRCCIKEYLLCWVNYKSNPKLIAASLILITIRVLGLPQSTEIYQRPAKKSRQGFTPAAAAVGGSKNKLIVPLLTPEGWPCSLYEVRVGVCPGVWLEGSLGDLPIPLLVWSAGGMQRTLLSLQGLHKWHLGCFVFLYFVHNLPQLHKQLFLVP